MLTSAPVTATVNQRDGRSLHVRNATVAETEALAIYRAMGISAARGGTRELISGIRSDGLMVPRNFAHASN